MDFYCEEFKNSILRQGSYGKNLTTKDIIGEIWKMKKQNIKDFFFTQIMAIRNKFHSRRLR